MYKVVVEKNPIKVALYSPVQNFRILSIFPSDFSLHFPFLYKYPFTHPKVYYILYFISTLTAPSKSIFSSTVAPIKRKTTAVMIIFPECISFSLRRICVFSEDCHCHLFFRFYDFSKFTLPTTKFPDFSSPFQNFHTNYKFP